jgi:hypothetical protein
MVASLKVIFLLTIASMMTSSALLVPASIRSIDATVIELAGAESTTIKNKIWEEINAAYIGPAQHFATATHYENTAQQARIADLLAENPNYYSSGGPDRTFEDLLKHSPTQRRSSAVVPQLLPRAERATLIKTLETSNNRNVAALLGIRDLSGLTRLHPAHHAAGAPYDSGVLTLALLIEGGHFQLSLAQKIGNLARLAAANNPDATIACEDFVIGTLSLGRQLDFCSLSSLATMTETLYDWSHMAALFRTQPTRIAELYTALRFLEATDILYTYLAEHPDTCTQDLDFALSHGPGAVNCLIRSGQPIYPSSLPAMVLDFLEPYRPQSFIKLTLQSNALGQALKFGLLFLAGLTFTYAIASTWRNGRNNTATISRSNRMVIVCYILISFVITLTIWMFFEPDILKSDESLSNLAPRIEFAAADTLQSLKSPVKTMQDLNQVTLLVLALFFIIQLIIYSYCLIKLKEISNQPINAQMKLRLIDNEENLFDFGLYVGLGGTVLSLILVAVGIVEASLMAAYASTLFGILFTAIFKVMHLRPYRRKLILETDASQAPSTSINSLEQS